LAGKYHTSYHTTSANSLKPMIKGLNARLYQAHNLKVVGSNPAPATNLKMIKPL
jgi:hypothetical protein